VPACGKCGEQNPAEARLCWSCGAGLPRPHAAERKLVTVLFVDLVEFTRLAEGLDPEDLQAIVTPYFDRVRTEVGRFGGRVEKYIGDAVMGLFGAPIAHGDDPERAVRSAFAIRRAIDDLNRADPLLDLKARIGVNTGEAFVDLSADPAAGEGMAAGDVVVTAFRLQQTAAVNGIVVGEATHRATERAIEYVPLEPVAAKGFEEPVRAWSAVAVREAATASGVELVGRVAELARLRSVVVSGAPDQPGFLTIVGPAGIGKSRLLRELRASLEDGTEPVVWLNGRCLAYGGGLSFSAFAEIVKSHSGILESDPAQVVERKLSAAVNAIVDDEPTCRWVEEYLGPLVGLGGVERLSGDRREEAFSAWRRFVEGLAGDGRVVLAFEDLHWSDDGQLDFVEHLAEWVRGAPLAVICTARPELGERRPQWPAVVRLEPLSTEDTGALVDLLLGSARPPDALRETLLARAAGNPLFAEELVRALQQEGDEDPRLPETVHGIIAGRLDALHPEAKGLVHDAAVIGGTFWTGALAHLSGLRPGQVERRLGELQWKEFVRPLARSVIAEESEYAFWHVLVRDVAYTQIPRAARAEKHRLAAEWIESLAPGRADLTELLAHHYTSALEYARLSRRESGGLEDRARVALRDAGEHALTLYAFPAAARFFRQALELWPERDPERPELLFRLGTALFWGERSGDSELAEARDALAAAGDRARAARADVLLSRLALARGDRDSASEYALGGVALLRGSPPSREQAEVTSNLAMLQAVRGESEHALKTSDEALALAEALSLDEIKAESLTFRGHARILGGDHGGLDDLEQAVEIAKDLRSPRVVVSCANLATSLVELGMLERAWAAYDEARNAATRFGDARGLHWLAAERVYEHYWRGNWEDALLASEAFLGESDAGYGEHAGRSVRAWIRLARGDPGGALEDSTGALEFARRAKDAAALCPALATNARVLAESGRNDEASVIVDDLLDLWAAGGVVASFWVADLAEALQQLGRGDELARLGTAGVPTRWLLAARHLVAGSYRDAAETYDAIGARPEAARARLHVSAALAAADRDEAEQELERALEFYREVGASGYLRAGLAQLATPV
jgi:class 3 adenylate cyclase/tetratricopeptide (TPR) repeat protein